MSYEAKFLSDKEFDALPYPETDVSLGIADPETRMAYVRRSGVPVVDAFRLAHELEHLDEDGQGIYSDHFKHGVYYKQNSWIAPVLGGLAAVFAPAVLPALFGGGAGAALPAGALMGPGAGFQGMIPGAMGSAITPQFGSAIVGAGVGSAASAASAGGASAGRGVLDLAGKAYSGAQTGSQLGEYLSSPSVLKPQPAQGEQTGRPGQQPASVIQSTPGFGAGAGGPGSMGLGPDVMKNIREKLSGTQAGRNTVMDLYGAPNPERGFGMNQEETF